VLGLQLLVVVRCDEGKHLMMTNSKHLLISELYLIRNNYSMSSKFFTCPVFRKSSKLSCLLYWVTECLIDCYAVLIALFNFNHWWLHYNKYLMLKQTSCNMKFVHLICLTEMTSWRGEPGSVRVCGLGWSKPHDDHRYKDEAYRSPPAAATGVTRSWSLNNLCSTPASQSGIHH